MQIDACRLAATISPWHLHRLFQQHLRWGMCAAQHQYLAAQAASLRPIAALTRSHGNRLTGPGGSTDFWR